MEFEHVKPMDIEKRSMEIIGQELAEMGISLPADKAHIIKRVIHTSADFDYAQTLTFSEDALERATDALKQGASIITDTKMAWSGINKRALENLGGQAYNFISDEDVAATTMMRMKDVVELAKEKGCTRAAASIDKAANLNGPLIFAVGNAPTALIRLHELITEGKLKPALIIGVPVGFVNVVQAKELIMETDVPYIVARGRKGGSNVAAAICNALLYNLDSSRGAKKP